jgi:hypothetical protein
MDEIIEEIFELGKDDAEAALRVLLDYGQTDGAHHKQWAIDQAVRALAGPYYEDLIAAYKAGEDGEDTYEWDEGIAP